MFSYRHAFHAGNHADVLKHITLIATLRHLMQKEASLTLIDSHAGAGLYRLDGDYTETGGEAKDGVLKLFAALRPAEREPTAAAAAIEDYMDLVASFNPSGALRVYPGSPFVMQRLMRAESRDKLKLFELHPTDSRTLTAHVGQIEAGRQIAVALQDGFEGMKAFLPPPPTAGSSRRAAVLIDPSYEVKTDYGRVSACLQEQLGRFPTGTYLVWYPVIPRPEAHDLPRRLKTLATQAKRPWLKATLAIGQDPTHGPDDRPGLTASGMFIINPPHTLHAALHAALPQLLSLLGRGRGQAQALETGG
ncbi:23S rRNA (adenine(2030)-N(6))-methyltransferase RlmJ [Hydrogenophaga sp.]|uniref:23S rRNA (adenine(2030)-N(6))-methyltransferase RlmJ n=1 Tax=Hydrogenophaga sp. TaxID=1904254 RepID=UPI001994F96C|nr:23S rRNA (adenine(2030)-N(6))-methyltransferase RlmJ [Hydrogenophaga sp.]MBD3892814.1 23S rRNA (adenine(2030)-N(6))-methyltransferase RlmJ [Hydrogenophaga sp.]